MIFQLKQLVKLLNTQLWFFEGKHIRSVYNPNATLTERIETGTTLPLNIRYLSVTTQPLGTAISNEICNIEVFSQSGVGTAQPYFLLNQHGLYLFLLENRIALWYVATPSAQKIFNLRQVGKVTTG